MEKNNQEIEFEMPGDVSVVVAINDILRKNGIKKNAINWLDWAEGKEDKESQVVIVRDTALIMAQKRIPEEKLAEFLQKHLETSKETAEKIIQDIKLKIVPFAKIVDLEKERELLPPGVKKIEVANVEENAKKMQKEKKFTEENKSKIIEESSLAEAEYDKEKLKINKFTTEKKGPDTYREPVE